MRRAILAVAAAALIPCGCAEKICDSAELAHALDDAQPGDTIITGACAISGAFTVRAGVHLRGSAAASRLIAAGDGAAVTLIPGPPAAALSDLTIESDARIAVLARGAGEVALERVSIHTTRGPACN